MNKLLFELSLIWDYDIVLPLTIIACIIMYDIMYGFRWLTNSHFRQRKMSLKLFQLIMWRQRQRSRLRSATNAVVI
jgi:hypothetical protein